MRPIAERVSIAEVRAAKACAGGQLSLVPAPRTSDAVTVNIGVEEREPILIT